jgi:hypothetical protein
LGGYNYSDHSSSSTLIHIREVQITIIITPCHAAPECIKLKSHTAQIKTMIWNNWSSPTLLLGVQIGSTTLKMYLEVCVEAKHKFIL